MPREKLLLLPAINIKNGLSRSFYFAKELAKYNDVYVTEWEDPQSAEFDNTVKEGKWNSILCFFKSIFSKIKINQHERFNFYFVKSPKLTLSILHKLLGYKLALKLIRYYNSIILKRLIKILKPTVLFYADGFDFYPAVKGDFIIISDIQDDFSAGSYRDSLHHQNYGTVNFKLADKNYIVSNAAKTRLSKYYSANFEYLPNGADFENLRAIKKSETNSLRKSMNLEGKLIVSFIGGGLWFDNNLSNQLFSSASKESPNIHFILIGNHKEFNYPNVTNLGRINNDETYKYYNLSDVGLFLKDSKGSSFLENSAPLKIIQYSSLNKWMITPFISWLDEEKFKNIILLKEFNPQSILKSLNQLSDQTQLSENDKKWNDYDWVEIGKKMNAYIISQQNKLN